MTLVLHNYFRSSTSARVRAALNLKGLDYDYVSYALLKDEQRGAAHLALNPQGLVPTLVTEDGALPQSLAIIEWLDEVHPEPPLLPADAWGRARVRSLAHIIALDVHPLNNLRILKHLETEYGVDADGKAAWFRKWAQAGMDSLEARLSSDAETGSWTPIRPSRASMMPAWRCPRSNARPPQTSLTPPDATPWHAAFVWLRATLGAANPEAS